MARSSTTVWALNDVTGQQELRPKASAMLPLSPQLKYAFHKFAKYFQAVNLPKGKHIKPPASTSRVFQIGTTLY